MIRRIIKIKIYRFKGAKFKAHPMFADTHLELLKKIKDYLEHAIKEVDGK